MEPASSWAGAGRFVSVDIRTPLATRLAGGDGPTKQKAARLGMDLAATAGATELVTCGHAHVSGVSPLTGGHGLRRFLADLSGDDLGLVEIPTTLNSAGCDKEKMEEMDIETEDFLKHQFEIVHAYAELGIEATQNTLAEGFERDIQEKIQVDDAELASVLFD